MNGLWEEIKPITVLCAVEQGFGIDPKYDRQVRAMARKGFIRLQCEWILTDKGREELKRLDGKP